MRAAALFEADLQYAIRRMFDGCEVIIRDTVYGWTIGHAGDGRGVAAGSIVVTCPVADATVCQQIMQRYGTVTPGPAGQTMEFYLVAVDGGS